MTLDTARHAYTDPDLYARNAAVLARKAPFLRTFIEKERSNYTVVRDEAGTTFLTGSGAPVFPEPEPAYSESRVRAFRDAPMQLRLQRHPFRIPVPDEMWSRPLRPLVEGVGAQAWHRLPPLEDATTLALFDAPATDAMIDLVSGLPDLRRVVVFVFDIDHFIAALHVTDWTAIVDVLDARDIDLAFENVGKTVSAAEAAATSLVGFSRVNPDNIPVYFHASGPIVKEVSSALQKEYTMASTGVGFFEDEIEMLRNTVQNIIVHDRPVITSREAHAGTAIIVGSGPSVDSTMEVLRKHAESAFVIAAGTAVETLLTAGVRVDCCVILERGKEVSEVFDEVSQRLDMSSVTLVGSSTIQSDLERHFRAGIYFFRPGLNIVRGFATGTKSILYNCDPTVSNTAAALAHFLGFRSILLFGVDMGSVHEHRHHSSQTAYYTSDVLRDLDVKMPVSVLATFGGMARTNFIFNWARDRLEEFIESHPDTDVILIGEGARIKGTVPVLPEAADMLDAIYPIIPIDEDLREVPAIPYDRSYYNYDIRHLEDFTGRLHDIIQEFSWDTRHAMTEKVMTTLWKHSRRDPFQMIMRGSVTEMIWSALSLLSALDPEDRPQYAEGLRDALANAITMMEETIKSVLAEADEPAPNT